MPNIDELLKNDFLNRLFGFLLGNAEYDDKSAFVGAAQSFIVGDKPQIDPDSVIVVAALAGTQEKCLEAVMDIAGDQDHATTISAVCYALIINKFLFAPGDIDVMMSEIIVCVVQLIRKISDRAADLETELSDCVQTAYMGKYNDIDNEGEFAQLGYMIYTLQVIKYSISNNRNISFKRTVDFIAQRGSRQIVASLLGTHLGYKKTHLECDEKKINFAIEFVKSNYCAIVV